ncbi:MAG TPA: toprim domain-containing protein [Halothiobacillus sp.]|nr:toprim domain-containing protein [Halothiobacillus sp.]
MNAAQIAERLNLKKYRDEFRGNCPACGYPSAFVLSTGKYSPIGWCSVCQNRDAVAAALEAAGADNAPRHPNALQPAKDSPEAKQKAREAAKRIWMGSVAATPDNAAGIYLCRRAIGEAITSPAIRYRPDCPHPSGERHHAMICAIQDSLGGLVAVQRVYLTSGGHKASVTPQKACKGPLWGGAIRFDDIASDIVIAEGPETAISAGIITGLPAWSAISAGNLKSGLKLPPEVRSIIIAADNDKPGIEAAEGAAARWEREGIRVRIIRPKQIDADFNDILQSRRGGSVK